MMTVLIIPALNPERRFLLLIEELINMGFERIVVVDDGSDEEYADIFEAAHEYGCRVFYHDRNYGKGRAIKTALKNAVKIYGKNNCFITLDADGQHLPSDIKRVALECMFNPEALVLGERNLNHKNVPARSRIGNKITSAYFKFETGIKCKDTQTGLRGIPSTLLELALTTQGDRYEYEMNFLLEAVKRAEVRYVDIKTVYEDNNIRSHFDPIRDSFRIYRNPIKYTSIAFTSSVLDYIIFCIMVYLLNTPYINEVREILMATVTARILSSGFNFYLNRRLIFNSENRAVSDATRYIVVFVIQMCASAFFVALLSKTGLAEQIGKPIVDTILFFVSYKAQKNWVFANKESGVLSGGQSDQRLGVLSGRQSDKRLSVLSDGQTDKRTELAGKLTRSPYIRR